MKDYKSIIRRITPTEASRLQLGAGLDDYLKIDGPQTSDSAQYKGIGNSWHAASSEFVSSRAEIVLREAGIVGGCRPINYATTCSGIENQSVVVRDKNWQAKFFSEIEKFPCRVLAARYPGVPNLGDMTKVDGTKWHGMVDLFSGGTPCQSVSVAGKRHGMAENSNTRSSLAFHWIRIATECDTPCVVWENVPGAFSANKGKDFAWFIWRINEAGYNCAWRVLDGQWNFSFNCPRALPQRRKRIWLVAFRGDDWRHAVRVLFERAKTTGPVWPVRVTLDGEVIEDEKRAAKLAKSGTVVDPTDLFGFFNVVQKAQPTFSKSSRADMIPYSEMPGEGCHVDSPRAVNFFNECGEVKWLGQMFVGGVDGAGVDALDPKMLENIGCGAGVAVGGHMVLLKQAEWNAGLQMPWGEKTAPDAYDGTVSALSDVLEPWGDYLGKYVLSHRACQGILNRAAKRGKKLDQILEDALHYQIAEWAAGEFSWIEAAKAAMKAGAVDDGEDGAEDGDADAESCPVESGEVEEHAEPDPTPSLVDRYSNMIADAVKAGRDDEVARLLKEYGEANNAEACV